MKFPTVIFRPLLPCLLAVLVLPAQARTIDERYPVVRGFFPEADRFGALQELTPQLARRLRVPQFEFPQRSGVPPDGGD